MTLPEDDPGDELSNPPKPPPKPSRTQATRLSGRDLVMLEEVAQFLGTDTTEASRRAIRHSHWLLNLNAQGRTLLVRDDTSGEIREVLILP